MILHLTDLQHTMEISNTEKICGYILCLLTNYDIFKIYLKSLIFL